MGLLRFHWLRHAPPINPQGLCYGSTDIAVDLSDLAAFKKQSQMIPSGAKWYASHSPRAQLTALKLVENHPDSASIMIQVEPDLIEQSFGDWVGLTYAEMNAHLDFSAYCNDPENQTPPNGESMNRLFFRVSGAIDSIIRQHQLGGDFALVAHGGSIRSAVARATGLSMKETLRLSVDPLSLSVIAFDHNKRVHGKNPWTLESMNLKP